MALQKTYQLENGLVVPNAYIKILTCTSTKNSASALVGVFADKAHADTTEPIFQWYQMFTPNYATDAKNLWEQAYEFLKTLPQFEGAENV